MTLSFPPFWALLYLICLSQKKYFVQISASSCSGQEFEETHDLPRQCKSKFRKTSLFLTQDVGGICELKIHFFFSIANITFVPKPVLFIEAVVEFMCNKRNGGKLKQ